MAACWIACSYESKLNLIPSELFTAMTAATQSTESGIPGLTGPRAPPRAATEPRVAPGLVADRSSEARTAAGTARRPKNVRPGCVQVS